MSETRWRPYRHKNNPEIEYYVEEIFVGFFAATTIKEWKPVPYHPEKYADQECWGNVDHVRIRSPRNVFHTQFDYPTIDQMPPGGLWPAKSFLELYEPA